MKYCLVINVVQILVINTITQKTVCPPVSALGSMAPFFLDVYQNIWQMSSLGSERVSGAMSRCYLKIKMLYFGMILWAHFLL
jgi:hypothetical protein